MADVARAGEQILLLNAGSSSLKAALVRSSTEEELATAQADWAGDSPRFAIHVHGKSTARPLAGRSHGDAVREVVASLTALAIPLNRLTAVGHRIVHGGDFSRAVIVTPEIRARIQSLIDLAPLHNPPSLNALDAAIQLFPGVPHIASFDTAFHATLPQEAWTYPIPAEWTRRWGIRRYGFHGLSHAYCSRRADALLGTREGRRLVICHLGHGCSASAVVNGRCVETTMGFTPLEGLMMATRSGSIDPAIVPFVQQQHGLSAEDAAVALNRQSGLLGVSGLSADMREILAARSAGHPDADLAFRMYCRRVRQAIGAFAVTMSGLDAVVFTAGVGEHSAAVRAEICRGLECLGLELDPAANDSGPRDADIATPASRARILVIATREDKTMLRDIHDVLSAAAANPE